MRIAVVGCGFQGAIHASSVNALPNAHLAVCCDDDASRAESVADAHGAAAWATDWNSVFDDETVDGVVIATPSHNHAELAVAAAMAGKDILLEKPMATTIEDCLEIERAVTRSGVRMLIGFKFRYAPAVVAAKTQIPEPTVLHAHTLYDATQTTSGWVDDRSLSGGRLMSSLVHSVDLLRHLSGSEPTRVTAEGASLVVRDQADPDTAVATIRFANGAIASLVHGTAGASPLLSTWSFQTAAAGINATISDHGRRLSLRVDGVNQADFVDDVEDPFATGMVPLMAAFADRSTTGAATPGPRDGTISVVVCRLIEKAIATGESQEVVIPGSPT
jgi:predicted dehydrogenase